MKKLFYLICFSLFINGLNAQTCFSNYSYSTNGLTANFMDSSFVNSGNIISHFWTFGDSSFSSLPNPTHIYQQAGTYLVCLDINTSLGCRSSFCDTLTVSVPIPQCQAGFSYSKTPAGSVVFTNTSVPLANFSYQWNFGDGSPISFAINPTHLYNSPGAYIVTLTASNFGITCSYTDTIIITSCVASFSYQNTFGTTFNFTNTSSNYPTTIYNWNFGDGSSSSQANPTHSYLNAGTYNVTLSIIDSINNCFTQTSSNLIVTHPCNAGFTYTINQDTAFFQNGASHYNSISYDFGDGSTSQLENPIHIYTQSGTYLVCQTVMDTLNSCTNTFCDSIVITVPPPCIANFTFTINNGDVSILNKAQNFSTISYDFGDGTTSMQANPMHSYLSDGSYIICQTVGNNNGCFDTYCDTITITIPPPCIAGFSHASNEDSAFFRNLASNYTHLNYDFGDGNTSSNENPTHIYASSGTYIVSQTVIDSINNCSDTLYDSLLISITPPCIAGFNYSINGDTVLFQNTASSFDSVHYSFGDGNFSNESNPVHAYQQSGKYEVIQYVFNNKINCIDSITNSISVTISFSCVAKYELALDTNNTNTLFLVNTSSKDNTHQYFWDFGDGTTSNVRTPSHFFSNNQRYNICLTVSDSLQNCTSTYCDFVGLDTNGQILKANGFHLKVIDGAFIGIDEPNLISKLNIYPNPTSNNLTVDIQDNSPGIRFILMNGKGIQIENGIFEKRWNEMDLQNLSKGIYFLRLYTDEESIVKRIIKL